MLWSLIFGKTALWITTRVDRPQVDTVMGDDGSHGLISQTSMFVCIVQILTIAIFAAGLLSIPVNEVSFGSGLLTIRQDVLHAHLDAKGSLALISTSVRTRIHTSVPRAFREWGPNLAYCPSLPGSGIPCTVSLFLTS